jgi:hypothetical protein
MNYGVKELRESTETGAKVQRQAKDNTEQS